MKRGELTVEALKERCKVNPVTHCWDWQGAMSENEPRVWTLDYERICKRVMSGPLAAWHIAYQAPPREKVLAVRAADPALNNTQVGAMLGLSHQVVGAIRTGKRHAGVTA